MRRNFSRAALRQIMDRNEIARAVLGLAPAGQATERPKPKPKAKPKPKPAPTQEAVDFLAASRRIPSGPRGAAVARPCECISLAAAPEAAEPESTTRFVVRLRRDTDPFSATAAVREMCGSCGEGGSLRSVQPFACRTAVVEGVPRETLMASEAVTSFEPDRVLRIGAVSARVVKRQMLPAGIQQIAAPAARYSRAVKPVNAHVFVLDTGVAKGHRDLNVVHARSFVASEPDPWDHHGHGTAVAGVIGARDNGVDVVGVAPGVRIYSLKVLDRTGSGLMSEVIAAVEHMIVWKRAMGRRVQNAVVANLSLGAYVGSADYTALDEVLRQATREGITVVVAAGNEGADASLYSPAHLREGIVVGACDINDRMTSWSNWGSPLSIHAPGDDILTTYLGNRIARISGTSFAAPHAAGAAALFLSRSRTSSPARVKAQLRRMAGHRTVPRVDILGRVGTTQMRLECRRL